MLERGGKKYIVHPNRAALFVYDRMGKVHNVWRLVKKSTS